MARGIERYNQLAIGWCGHVVSTWPSVHKLGTTDTYVYCEECAKEHYTIPDDEEIPEGWVRLKTKGDSVEEPEKRKVVKKAAKKRPKKLRCSLCQREGHVFTDCPLMQDPMV